MADINTTIAQTAEPAATPERSKWLTFHYALAMCSVIVATVLAVALMYALAALWHGKVSAGVILGVSAAQVAAGLGIAVMAVLFAMAAFLLFGRVSKEAVVDRSGFTRSTGYKLITYSGLGALLLFAVPQVAYTIGILVSSLLLIGVRNAGTVYGLMYIGGFLPAIVGLVLIMAMAFFVSKIIHGVNKTRLMSIILLAVTVVLLVAASITLAVKAHSTKSTFEPFTLQQLKNSSLFRNVN